MQDISRDDISLLSGEREKGGSTLAKTTPLASSASRYIHNCSICPENSPSNITLFPYNKEIISVESDDLNTFNALWRNPDQTKYESAKLLLRNSDDPLISIGVTNDDDNRNELEAVVIEAKTVVKSPSNCVSDTKKLAKYVTTSKRGKNCSNNAGKPRRKGKFKLRFHHQALPAEYLSHYEMTQYQRNGANDSYETPKTSTASNNNNNQVYHTQTACERSTNSHERVRDRLEKNSQKQPILNYTDKESLETDKSCDINMTLQSPQKVVEYSHLPYMGEITLPNSKPRRGRKPKKADICHLIYKNYGKIPPGISKTKVDVDKRYQTKQSLLEKFLSQDIKKLRDGPIRTVAIEKPLNLCLRDQSGDSSALLNEKENSGDLDYSARTSSSTTQSDGVTDALLASNMKLSLPSFQSVLLKSDDKSLFIVDEDDNNKLSPPSFSHCSNSSVFLHPMSYCYPKVLNSSGSTPSLPSVGVTTMHTLSASSTTQNSPKLIKKRKKRLSPKTTLEFLPELIKNSKSDISEPYKILTPIKSGSVNNCTGQNQKVPTQKRKRSAIFIPPMPAQNKTNPATEVSICKFKFIGGIKPSLQEKKILSVDSDGNYRYYSGTGDKSVRGYEFFPRETLKQSGVVPGVNCSEAFLNATGEKILGDYSPLPTVLNTELLRYPNSLKTNFLFSQSIPLLNTLAESHRHHHLSLSEASNRRKRKSQRSMQREKLEQTFKEKGFLIQTQQLESAEGATYCKFRQLRKFTRYLFRSWKDYLPDEIQKSNAVAVAAVAAANSNVSDM